MELDRRQRVRLAILGAVTRRLLASPRVRRFFLARARADVDAGMDHDLVVLAGLEARTRDSQVWRHPPPGARRALRGAITFVDDATTARPVTTRDLTVAGAAGPRPARLYTPAGAPATSPALVFFHGGGWVTGDLDTHDGLCRKLAALGSMRVIAIDYRLAPEHPYPAAADDAVAAFRDVARRTAELGFDPTRLGVGGDSAGGNLSAIVANATRRDAVRPALQVLLYPATDLTCSSPSHTTRAKAFVLNAKAIAWYRGHYLGPSPTPERLREPTASPLFATDLGGVAPAYIVVAGFDPLRDEALTYADRLRAARVAVTVREEPSLVHGFLLFTAVSPACARATDAICVDVGARLAR